jgi:hypothetical protein
MLSLVPQGKVICADSQKSKEHVLLEFCGGDIIQRAVDVVRSSTLAAEAMKTTLPVNQIA